MYGENELEGNVSAYHGTAQVTAMTALYMAVILLTNEIHLRELLTCGLSGCRRDS
jgi:hypothetical protein